MHEYIIILAEKDAGALGRVRCWPGAQAARQDGVVWLRGIFAKDRPPVAIRQLPAVKTYRAGEGGLLFPEGALTPVGELPRLNWQSLKDFIPVELPVSALPGRVTEQAPVRLVASGRAEQGAALLTTRDAWANWVETAPSVRLQCLHFAASADGKALILGAAMPPLPGRELWMRHQILLPAGFDFEYPVVSELIQRKYNPGKQAMLLFDENGRFDKIDGKSFVRATRSAVRMTQF